MDKDVLQLAIKNLAISMVYLDSTETKLLNEFDPLTPGQKLTGQIRMRAESHRVYEQTDQDGNVSRYICYKIAAEMRYLKDHIPKEDDEENSEYLASEIKASFIARYNILATDEEIPDKAFVEFGRVNAPFNVWPYWREFCQSACSRMALPVTVMPMYKIED